MKLLLLTMLIPCFLQAQNDSVTYDTYKPELGFLVGYDNSIGYWYVQKIYKIEVWQHKQLPCSTVYHWKGNKKKTGEYWSSGRNWFSDYPSKYKGDSIISYNCQAWEYSPYETYYYKPCEDSEYELGEKYELKLNEHYAELKDWYPKPFYIMIGKI